MTKLKWTKQAGGQWEARMPNDDLAVIYARKLKGGTAYDLVVGGVAIRRLPKLNEAKAHAESTVRLIGRLIEQPEPRPRAPRPLVGAAAAAKARAGSNGAKSKAEPRACLCGCGEQTKGGTFVAGHDARYKSALVREAIAGNQEAVEALETRGWTKFLDKGRETATRREAAGTSDGSRAQRRERIEAEAEQAANALQRIATMKQARVVLVALGRYGKAAGDRRIEIAPRYAEGGERLADAVEVAQAIVDGTHPDYADDAERALAAKIGKES